MNARRLVLTTVALLALAAPAAQACNINADKDAAVRMSSTAPGRDVLTVQRTSKAPNHVASSELRTYPH